MVSATKLRVLFTGGGGAGSEAIYRLLCDRYDVYFADADIENIDPVIPADRRHAILYASDPRFEAAVGRLCAELMIDLLVPSVDEELLGLSELGASADLNVLLPSQRYISLALDKRALMQKLSEKGIDIPRTLPAARAAEIGFPCIVKPRSGRGSRDVRIVESEQAAAGCIALGGGSQEAWIAQELLCGQEFTVMMAADSGGNLRAVVPVKVDIKRGITLRASTVDDPVVRDACVAIHNALPTPGCYNIQLIRTAAGRAAPFEINPRISTTFVLCLAAGIDPVEIFQNTPASGDLANFSEGQTLKRFWRNHFE